MKNIIFITLIIILGVYAQKPFKGKPPYNYGIAANTKYSPIDIHVPKHHSPKVKEIGFSFWLKASYFSPSHYNFEHLHWNWPSIAGISDKNNDYCSTHLRNRFLALFLANAKVGDRSPHYHFVTYQNNNGNRYRNMKFPDGRYDFDHSWNFISFTYSFEEKQATAAVHFGKSGQVRFFEFRYNWKLTPQDLKFRIGPCKEGNPVTFQGQYHDVNFQWSIKPHSGIFIKSEEQFQKYMKSRHAPTDKPADFYKKLVVSGILTKKASDTTINRWNFGNLNGINEYAVWGWCKWDFLKHKKPWHLIYRYSNLKEGHVQNISKIGDRTLAAWVGNGFIHFSTYTFDYFGGHNKNVAKNVYYRESDLNKWFFVYQGHSFEDHKTVAYVHFDSKDTRMEWNDNWHYKPDDATFYLGKDKFHPAFNGSLKQFYVALGKGAFRDYYFEDICGDECFQEEEKYVDLVEPQTPAATLIKHGMKQKHPAVKIEVPKHELKDIEDTSYSFWFRWNFFHPNEFNLHAFHSQYLPLATLSETGNEYVKPYSRKQSIWFSPFKGNPKLHFTTYNKAKHHWNAVKNMNFEDPKDLDSSWNFLYYGYCKRTQKLFAYVKFGRSGACQTIEFKDKAHSHSFNKLIFKLGQSDQYPNGFNGHFWNVRFYYKGYSYLGSKDAVESYFYSSKVPELYYPLIDYKDIHLLGNEKLFSYKKTHPITKGPIQDVQGAEEYAIYGWAKWKWLQHKKPWHILFRYTNYDEKSYSNIGFGQRDLACWVGNGYLHFATYNYHVNGKVKDWNWTKNIKYGNDLEKWFFFYVGYSHVHQRVVMHVKFASRKETVFMNNVNHALPFKPYVYLGHDKFHPGFNGWMKNVKAVFGPGTYQEKDYDNIYY